MARDVGEVYDGSAKSMDGMSMGQNLRKPSLYDDDFYGWTREQAELLRQGRLGDADLENIVEEIETLGRSERRELESAYRLICIHLLKIMYQPDRATRSWINTIVRERNNAESILAASPSLKGKRSDLFASAYRQARKEAAAETGLPLNVWPDQPPFTRNQAEDDAFIPLAIVEASPSATIEHDRSVESDG